MALLRSPPGRGAPVFVPPTRPCCRADEPLKASPGRWIPPASGNPEYSWGAQHSTPAPNLGQP